MEILYSQLKTPDIATETLSSVKPGRKIYLLLSPRTKDPIKTTIATAVDLQRRGFDPVPHIAVRNCRDLGLTKETLNVLHAGEVCFELPVSPHTNAKAHMLAKETS